MISQTFFRLMEKLYELGLGLELHFVDGYCLTYKISDPKGRMESRGRGIRTRNGITEVSLEILLESASSTVDQMRERV